METVALEDLTQYLISRIKDVIYYGFNDEYNKVLKQVTEGQAVSDVRRTSEMVLRKFQEQLMQVDVWEIQRFYTETERVMEQMERVKLGDVLSEIIFYHSLVFCKTKNNVRVIEQVPLRVKDIDFVKLLYETMAKHLYKNPGLFDKFLKPLKRMENVGEIYSMIDRAIRETLLAFVPIESLIQIPFKFPPKAPSREARQHHRQQDDQQRQLFESQKKKQLEMEEELGRLRSTNETLSKKLDEIVQAAEAKLEQRVDLKKPQPPELEDDVDSDDSTPTEVPIEGPPEVQPNSKVPEEYNAENVIHSEDGPEDVQPTNTEVD